MPQINTMKKTILFSLAILLVLSACKKAQPVDEDWDAYISDYESWQHQRLERLKTENGWLNLAGLFWLKQGENTIGSDSTNDIVFPAGFAPFGGKIILKDTLTFLELEAGVEILADSIPAPSMELKHDQQPGTTLMQYGSFRWFIIKRGTKYGIRLRDLEHPRIKSLDHIPAYPFKKEYVVEASYVPYDSARTIEVPTVIEGFNEYYKVPGELQFKINGKKQVLLPFTSRNGYFLIVGDATNGAETYGAGRFLYIESEKDGEHVIIDFNRLYNPPCAFSPYATCPIPPLENILDIKIEAGEKGIHLE